MTGATPPSPSVPPPQNDAAVRSAGRAMRDEPSLYKDAEAGHLDDAALTAFVSGAVGQDRAAVVAHLSECARCRRAVASVSRALADPHVGVELSRLETSPSRRRWRWVAVGLAAAATVLLFVNPFREREGGSSAESPLRGSDEVAAPASLVAPAEDQVVPAGSASFVWHGLGSDVAYRLTVADERGDVVWTRQSTDTTARVDRTLLHVGRRYFWYVDALFPDGRSTASEVRRVRIAP